MMTCAECGDYNAGIVYEFNARSRAAFIGTGQEEQEIDVHYACAGCGHVWSVRIKYYPVWMEITEGR